MIRPLFVGLIALLISMALPASAYDQQEDWDLREEWTLYHALAMHGTPAHKKDFEKFDYVHSAAPKGGQLIRAEIGTFDSLNPFLLIGQAPASMTRIPYFDTLMRRNWNEPFTMYPLIAEAVVPIPGGSILWSIRP